MLLISQEYFGGHQQDVRLWKDVKTGFTHFAEKDVLLAKITPCFQNGKSCIAENLLSGYGAGTTELHVLRCIDLFTTYLLAFLKNPMFLEDASKNMTGTAGQQRVPTDYIKNTLFPLPPFAEQARIVAKVDELMALCAELKASREAPVKTDVGKIIAFPQQEQAPLAMVARGSTQEKPSKQLEVAIDDLFGDDFS